MKRIVQDWLMLFRWIKSPLGFSDFEEMKYPEHYEQSWFYERERPEFNALALSQRVTSNRNRDLPGKDFPDAQKAPPPGKL